jgi:hypothetical protein
MSNPIEAAFLEVYHVTSGVQLPENWKELSRRARIAPPANGSGGLPSPPPALACQDKLRTLARLSSALICGSLTRRVRTTPNISIAGCASSKPTRRLSSRPRRRRRRPWRFSRACGERERPALSGVPLRQRGIAAREPTSVLMGWTPPLEWCSTPPLWHIEAVGGGASNPSEPFNAPFDWSFVNYYFHRFTGANPFGFTALDIKAVHGRYGQYMV